MLLCGSALAQPLPGDTLVLSALLPDSLSEITVIGRRGERAERVLAATEVIPARAIERAQALTTADALAALSGVYVQKSQFGGGSPVLRGFEANRVLLVVDGVRMNNAIYRSGHLQNAIAVDPLALAQLEVIYGAGSLAYGSDALGGVVHFRTRDAEFRALTQDAGLRGEVAVNGASAARSLNLGTRLEYGGRRWAGLTLLSTLQTSHLRAGAHGPADFPAFGRRPTYVDRIGGQDRTVDNPNPLRQIGTAYNQYNLLQKFRFQLRDRVELKANLQLSTTGDVPRYDNLTERRDGELRWARWDYGPGTRTLAALTLSDRRPARLYDLATTIVSHQLVEEDRIRRRYRDPLEENNLETVHTINLQTDLAKSFNNSTLRYGIDLRHDAVTSEAFIRDIESGTIDRDNLPTRYPSQASSLSAAGVYADLERPLSDNWVIRGGARLAYQQLKVRFGPDDPIAWPVGYIDGTENATTSISGSVGLRRSGERGTFRLVGVRGFRAPNVDDFGKFRERNGFVLIPNLQLGPEYTHTLEVGYRWQNADRIEVGGTAYHTWLQNAIIRGPGALPDGRNSFLSNGELLFTQTNENAVQARIRGLDVFARYRPIPRLTLLARGSYLVGTRSQSAPDGRVLELSQDHIPPPYGNLTATYSTGRWSAGLRARFQTAKPVDEYAVGEISLASDGSLQFDRTGTPDNLELTPRRPNGTFAGTPAWWTLDLFADYTFSRRWKLRLKADNIFDRHYRPFASGVSAPGVDAGLGLNYLFGPASN